jgi:hypothetical protein
MKLNPWTQPAVGYTRLPFFRWLLAPVWRSLSFRTNGPKSTFNVDDCPNLHKRRRRWERSGTTNYSRRSLHSDMQSSVLLTMDKQCTIEA